MKYCSNCGKPIEENAKYCSNCGSEIYNKVETRTDFIGKVVKCPNCGETINTFVTECPSCGYEFQKNDANKSVSDLGCLIAEYNKTRNTEKPKSNFAKLFIPQSQISQADRSIIETIKSHPIANTKEDIVEFIILASSNIDFDAFNLFNYNDIVRREISKAWKSKIDQAYAKAKMMLVNEPEYDDIKNTYKRTIIKIRKEKLKLPMFLVCGYAILFLLFWGDTGAIQRFFSIILIIALVLFYISLFIDFGGK